MNTKILLVDNHKIMREGLRHLIQKLNNMEVIGEAGDGLTAVKKVKELSPDVVIMDVVMPGLNGIEATRQIIAEAPQVKVIALSMYSERRFILEMFKAGASAYLIKDGAFEELAQAIKSVCGNQLYLSPAIVDEDIQDYIHNMRKIDFSYRSILTKRQCQVLQLIAEGKTTKDIASLLDISIKTVETHRQKIKEKLGIYSIAQLTKYAIREGLTTLEF